MNFPKELITLRQWICWRLEPDPKSDKPRKVPYDPKTGRKASSTNPESWATLAEAQAAREKFLFTGIGFVFTEECGIVGVDIDHCRNDDGSFTDVAKAILEKAQSYTEVSPSGSGLHILLRGVMPGKGNKNSTSGVEMYAAARYFTMTGNRLEGTPEAIMDGKDILPWIHENYIAKKTSKKAKAKKALRTVSLTDEQVLEKARAAQNGDDFSALWDGSWEGKFGSQSEADLSLCCSLAFWTGKNKEQMDRLFRQSKLFREKWDKVHHANGATYGEETLEQAIARTENVYTPGGELGIYEANGRYIRERGENVYPLTNFTIQPIDMIESEEETQMNCDLVTMAGETYRLAFMTSDFVSSQKFKAILNKRTIALCYMGSDGDLEVLKAYISGLDWKRKRGVKALGLYEHDGRWVFVDKNGAFAAGNDPVDDIVQINKYAVIDSEVPTHDAISSEHMATLGQSLLDYNEPAKTVTVLAWCAGCYLKELLRASSIKFPHLFLIGEAGSGKSTTLERVVQPIMGRNKVNAAAQLTSFVMMRESASSNLFPQALDEFKPSKLEKAKNNLYNHFRSTYDGQEGVRGRADQTQVTYTLLAPLIVAGEESPDETSVRDRSMELTFSKKDVQGLETRAALLQLTERSDDMAAFGRALLDTALTLNTKTVLQWYKESIPLFKELKSSRIASNLSCCAAGLRLIEAMLARLGLSWGQVFTISMDSCIRYLIYGVKEYLLDGGDSNKTIVEQTMEVLDRMGLTNDEFRTLPDGNAAFYVKGFYDRYTQYRRDHAITGECLPYAQFMKQLKKSDLYIDMRVIRFGDDTRRAVVLNYPMLCKRCDIDGFLHFNTEPLTGP
ncbi:MAG: DNA primase [Clostridia bacterium]|nr:DNA primase [Clostridia bacterium]